MRGMVSKRVARRRAQVAAVGAVILVLALVAVVVALGRTRPAPTAASGPSPAAAAAVSSTAAARRRGTPRRFGCRGCPPSGPGLGGGHHLHHRQGARRCGPDDSGAGRHRGAQHGDPGDRPEAGPGRHLRQPPGRVGQATADLAGVNRTYAAYRPANLPLPAPVVFMFHGAGGSARDAADQTGWDTVADRNGFLVVDLDGVDGSFNGGGGCRDQPGANDVDDVGAVVDLVGPLHRRVSIDDGRLFAVGFSAGAILTYRLACETGNLFAAVASVSGTQLGSCPRRGSTSLLEVHGDADTIVGYGGGSGAVDETYPAPSIPDVVAGWQQALGCGAPTTVTGAGEAVQTAACPGGRTVELVNVHGGLHEWPAPTTLFAGTADIWAFFRAAGR